MSRTISLAAQAANNAEATGDLFIFLLTVTHPSIVTPLLFSSDPTTLVTEDPLQWATVSRGNTYNFLPIGMVMPDDSDATPPTIKLSLDNVTRQLMPLLRSITTPASVTIEMVLRSAPDSVEVSWPDFDLTSNDYDQGTVTVNLTIEALATEPFPAGTFSPAAFSGLF